MINKRGKSAFDWFGDLLVLLFITIVVAFIVWSITWLIEDYNKSNFCKDRDYDDYLREGIEEGYIGCRKVLYDESHREIEKGLVTIFKYGERK
jgi:hypothetical protein